MNPRTPPERPLASPDSWEPSPPHRFETATPDPSQPSTENPSSAPKLPHQMPKKPLSPNPYIQPDHDSSFATKPIPVPFDLPISPTSAAQNIPLKENTEVKQF